MNDKLVTPEEIEAWKKSDGTLLNKHDAIRLMDTVLLQVQQAEELYKRAFDDGAMATQTYLESLRVSQLDEECERLRTVNRDLKVQVQRWIDKASRLEVSLADAKGEYNHIKALFDEMGDQRDAAVAANKAEFEAHKLTISDQQKEIRKFIDVANNNANEREAAYEHLRIVITAMQGLLDEIALCRFTKQCEPLMIPVVDAEKARAQAAQRVSKHSRIFTGADGSSFLGKE